MSIYQKLQASDSRLWVKGSVHIDHSEWSGILYLNPYEQAQGGIDFLRHKKTRMDRAPITPEGLIEQGFSNYGDVWPEVLLPDGKNQDAWELEMRVPAKFNRLVLLRPNLFHNPTSSFGTSIQDARLVCLIFFKYAQGFFVREIDFKASQI